MKNIVVIVISIIIISCSYSKYQVVSEVSVNLYHLHNPKTNDVQVIFTDENLKVGEWYRLNNIKTIDTEGLKSK